MDRKKLIIAGVAAVVVVIIAAVTFALTRGESDDALSPTTAPDSTEGPTTTAPAGPTAPLTGLPQPDEGLRTRPLLTVKIDNSPDARPQFGLEKADGIVEEKVEGGISRFMALYQSEDAEQVGPVRSLRTTDAAWLHPVGGMLAFSGSIPAVAETLTPAGIQNVSGDRLSQAYYKRRSDRPYEHSMWIRTAQLRELTDDNLNAPPPLYAYHGVDEAFDGAGASGVSSVSGRMGAGGGSTTFDWTWNAESGKFLRGTDGKAHEFENAGQIAMDNVILQYTPYRATQYKDRANTAVDEAVTTGTGDAWILSDGKLVQGKWSRPTDTDVTVFTDSAGAQVKLQPGKTWLSLVPNNLVASANP